MTVLIVIGTIIFVLGAVVFIDEIRKDISNLYFSRDGILKEHQVFVKASLRRDKELRQRIHKLNCKVSKYGKPRGSNETFKTDSEEACCQGSIRDRQGATSLG